ncbi:hypothetical protein [Burkholderia cenocepacia]|uniref:hypothetical protein n=1 Tax=Burkholderia cenocepacia TaxID=95486 RepID=UPI002230C7CD|nr:hypothetical protein [Burkholderia cenocepacia]MCW3641339.1 hypothetical protein [Burkholderia cenocepacia]
MSLESLDPKFVRRVGLLCCHCVRNIAYYRVGFVNEDGSGDLKQRTQFGATVNSDMLDIAVLEWCKLFADRKALHHWKRVIRDESEQQRFLDALLRHAGTKESGWTHYLDSVRVYRDKFVAHLDDLPIMQIPSLEVALKCVLFLYAYLRANCPASTFAAPHFGHLPEDLSAYYEDCRDEARQAYDAGKGV